MARGSDSTSIYPETLNIPAGASILVTALPGQISVLLKYVSGGSLAFSNVGDSYGCSFAVAQQYVFTAGEAIGFDSTGSFYLSAFGATVVAFMTRMRTAGTGFS